MTEQKAIDYELQWRLSCVINGILPKEAKLSQFAKTYDKEVKARENRKAGRL